MLGFISYPLYLRFINTNMSKREHLINDLNTIRGPLLFVIADFT